MADAAVSLRLSDCLKCSCGPRGAASVSALVPHTRSGFAFLLSPKDSACWFCWSAGVAPQGQDHPTQARLTCVLCQRQPGAAHIGDVTVGREASVSLTENHGEIVFSPQHASFLKLTPPRPRPSELSTPNAKRPSRGHGSKGDGGDGGGDSGGGSSKGAPWHGYCLQRRSAALGKERSGIATRPLAPDSSAAGQARGQPFPSAT